MQREENVAVMKRLPKLVLLVKHCKIVMLIRIWVVEE